MNTQLNTQFNKPFTIKTIRIFSAAMLGAAVLSGCGDTNAEEEALLFLSSQFSLFLLASFSSSVSDFTDYIQDADEKLNNLDIYQATSADELLEILDEMDARFAEFASIDMPAQYEGVKGLAAQASEEMSLAVSHYHTAFESEPFNENYADAAYQCYKNSYEYVQYMGYLIAGEKIPENDHVKVYEETNDKNILDKWLSDDESETNTASDQISE